VSCRERVIARIFPAMKAVKTAAAPAGLGAEGDAACYYHAANEAVVACDVCGRFLCALCELDLDGRRLCPACLERGLKVEKTASLEARRTQYDSMALHLLTWPLLTCWLPVFTAPAALFVVLRHWKTRMSILPRTRFRLWIALLLGVAEIVGIIVMTAVLIWAVVRAAQVK
jgi:hypothetical protein